MEEKNILDEKLFVESYKNVVKEKMNLDVEDKSKEIEERIEQLRAVEEKNARLYGHNTNREVGDIVTEQLVEKYKAEQDEIDKLKEAQEKIEENKKKFDSLEERRKNVRENIKKEKGNEIKSREDQIKEIKTRINKMKEQKAKVQEERTSNYVNELKRIEDAEEANPHMVKDEKYKEYLRGKINAALGEVDFSELDAKVDEFEKKIPEIQKEIKQIEKEYASILKKFGKIDRGEEVIIEEKEATENPLPKKFKTFYKIEKEPIEEEPEQKQEESEIEESAQKQQELEPEPKPEPEPEPEPELEPEPVPESATWPEPRPVPTPELASEPVPKPAKQKKEITDEELKRMSEELKKDRESQVKKAIEENEKEEQNKQNKKEEENKRTVEASEKAKKDLPKIIIDRNPRFEYKGHEIRIGYLKTIMKQKDKKTIDHVKTALAMDDKEYEEFLKTTATGKEWNETNNPATKEEVEKIIKEMDPVIIEGLVALRNNNIINNKEMLNSLLKLGFGVEKEDGVQNDVNIFYDRKDLSKGAWLPWNRKVRDNVAINAEANKNLAGVEVSKEEYDSRNPIQKMFDKIKTKAFPITKENEKETETAEKETSKTGKAKMFKQKIKEEAKQTNTCIDLSEKIKNAKTQEELDQIMAEARTKVGAGKEISATEFTGLKYNATLKAESLKNSGETEKKEVEHEKSESKSDAERAED